MKHSVLLISLICALPMMAQTSDTTAVKDTVEGFRFTTIDSVAITSVKDQYRTGTCWCFSGLAFLESELIRMGKGVYDLSEMFVVSHTMMDRATYFVRQYGSGSQFSAGGTAWDVIYCLGHYGLVPQSVMPGIRYAWTATDTLPVHKELDAVAKGYLKALTNSGLTKLSSVWREGLQSVYDTYLGTKPDTFTYKGQMYTPITFAQSLGLNADDYITFTSYTHHPFYSRFALEVPDNWRMHEDYNIPIDELMQIIDNALTHGYTLIWAADMSEPTFTRNGIAVMPDIQQGADLTGTDMAHWLGLDDKAKGAELTKKPLPEITVTQEMRQQAYDNWENYDDHGMQIYGIAQDQNGTKYYLIKNSWGTRSKYKGIWYISETYMRYKTNQITVHRQAVPKSILKKCIH